jgi:cysteinyl-tRNA synthetase
LALTIIYDVLKDKINDGTKLFLVREFDKVLSLNLTEAQIKEDCQVNSELEQYILSKISERNEARKQKNFDNADKIREELLAKGIIIKDTKEGTVWSIQES